MPSLKRGKDNVLGVVLSTSTADGGGNELRHIPAYYTLSSVYPTAADGSDATPVTAGSGNVANASAVATIPAVAGKTAYISGFTISGAGSHCWPGGQSHGCGGHLRHANLHLCGGCGRGAAQSGAGRAVLPADPRQCRQYRDHRHLPCAGRWKHGQHGQRLRLLPLELFKRRPVSAAV
jgi:hypothetical protein